MKRLVLIDGNALLHRAYHATPPLTTSKGELVNAVYGFTSMLLRSISELYPDFLAVAWDAKGPTFRHQTFTQYKATRGPADDALSSQYKRVFEIVEALNIPMFSISGYEADDLIGTLTRQAIKQEKALEVIIVTGDRDIMQLIEKRVKVFMPKKTLQDVGLYGEEEFVARFGFNPKNLVDYKALAGDASDNIPGVAGIGEVTATKLIHQFGAIEKLFKDLFGASLKDIVARASRTLPSAKAERKPGAMGVSERVVKFLAEGAESAVMSKNLATIDTNAPIKLDLAACRVHDFDREKITKLLEELEFKSLIARVPGSEQLGNIQKASSPESQTNRNSDTSGISEFSESFRNDTTDLDLAVTPVLQKMSEKGVMVDLKFLKKLGKELKAKLASLEKEIYRYCGHKFNINSPKQLSEVLFDELKLPVMRKTKTGRSTDEATLQQLQGAHPIMSRLLQYRQLFKLISTYIDALPKYADKSGRIHSTFNVEGAATGRLSSQNPNLQNIPIRGELGGEIRKAFIASKSKVLLAADYSQIELRIMAHLSDDPNLKKAFNEGLDIHAATASKIFKIPLEQVTKQQRGIGKLMNFATLYGQGPHALSRQLGVDYATARQLIAEYFEQFPKVREWMSRVLAEGFEKGYVETIWGRKRHIPELQAANRVLKAAGERAAVNHPVQGCLPWETKILSSWGYIPIGELYAAKKRPPFVWDGTGWRPYEVLNRGKAQLAQIKFSNGQVFKCDVRHKVLTMDEFGYRWTEFSVLKPGVKVCFAMPKVHELSSKSFRYKHAPKVHNGALLDIAVDKEFWYWLGYYIGDGYLQKRWNRAEVYSLTYYFGEHEIEKREQCIKFFTSLGLNPRQRRLTHRPRAKLSTRYLVTIYSQGIGRLFEALGFLAGRDAHTKRLSPRIFTETLENRCAFIRGVMDSDGYQGVKSNNNPNIHVCQRELLQEMQLLLRTVGVASQIRGPYGHNGTISYRLDIHRNALVKVLQQGEMSKYNRFLNKMAPQFIVQEAVFLGGHLQKQRFATGSDYVLYSRWKNGGSSSLYHLNTWLNRNEVTLQAPLYDYNEIIEVETLDEIETTYTLSVPGSHRFDSEGVISKNTAADMIKKAMVEIDKELSAISHQTSDRKNLKTDSERSERSESCSLILQVHDELLFECDPKEAEVVGVAVKEKMESAIELSVPVLVELRVGPNWGEMKPLAI